MSENEFWDATPAYFYAREAAAYEAIKTGWEQTRFLAYVMAKTVDTKKRIKRPADLLEFPWDGKARKTKFKRISMADLQQFSDEADEVLRITNPAAYAAYMAGKQQQHANATAT